MAPASSNLKNIQNQFQRQGDSYKQLDYVSNIESLKRVIGFTGASPGDRVLDLACGPSYLTMAFAEAGTRATGVDATESFLQAAAAEARSRSLSSLDLLLGDVKYLPLADCSYDLAICRAAFHHFPEPGNMWISSAR